jgi:hypothetical protein
MHFYWHFLFSTVCQDWVREFSSRHKRQVVDQDSKTVQETKCKATTLPVFMHRLPVIAVLIFFVFIGQQTSKYMLS